MMRQALIDMLHAEMQGIAALPDVRARLTPIGATPSCMGLAVVGPPIAPSALQPAIAFYRYACSHSFC